MATKQKMKQRIKTKLTYLNIYFQTGFIFAKNINSSCHFEHFKRLGERAAAEFSSKISHFRNEVFMAPRALVPHFYLMLKSSKK